jgi:hypothetical protein
MLLWNFIGYHGRLGNIYGLVRICGVLNCVIQSGLIVAAYKLILKYLSPAFMYQCNSLSSIVNSNLPRAGEYFVQDVSVKNYGWDVWPPIA